MGLSNSFKILYIYLGNDHVSASRAENPRFREFLPGFSNGIFCIALEINPHHYYESITHFDGVTLGPEEVSRIC